MYEYICIYETNLRTAAVSLFESSPAQLRSNENLEEPYLYFYYIYYITFTFIFIYSFL